MVFALPEPAVNPSMPVAEGTSPTKFFKRWKRCVPKKLDSNRGRISI